MLPPQHPLADLNLPEDFHAQENSRRFHNRCCGVADRCCGPGRNLAPSGSDGAVDARCIAGQSRSPLRRIPKRPGLPVQPAGTRIVPLNRLKPAPDGTVLTADGTTGQLHQLIDGKITLVSFVYLTCGDVDGCPLAFSTLYDIHDASAQLPDLRQDVQLMTISFDPERDTVEAIAAFAHPVSSDPASAQKLDWQVLTTPDTAALQPLLDGFGQVVDRGSADDQINHLLRMYLVDRHGMIRNVYGLGLIDPRLLMTDVETLLLEEVGK
ncbi:SCO family protein [Phaeobacter inhibens]|uniref:SCO family protein n=1 Tax=Phaeobacter inhibens TaxID=221822 RepID=UPI00016330C6|nr:SCO family protein [Phaeobacter inhibens]AFO90443.1 hypothetical protein PGA1_c07150 [Phaeobacter inhibens DSM 17395]AUQ45092.1 putative protein SCO1/SenC/PrrC [Phaeobacter inhibens]